MVSELPEVGVVFWILHGRLNDRKVRSSAFFFRSLSNGYINKSPSNITLFNLFLTLHVSIEVDYHQKFSTNPQKEGKILLFAKSLKYCRIYIRIKL